MIIVGGGDGWCYGFDAKPQLTPRRRRHAQAALEVRLQRREPLQGRPEAAVHAQGRPQRSHRHAGGRGRPRVRDGRPGLPPRPGQGHAVVHRPERRTCAGDPRLCSACARPVAPPQPPPPRQAVDITKTGRVWSYDKINRSFSTCSVVDGLVYVGDGTGGRPLPGRQDRPGLLGPRDPRADHGLDPRGRRAHLRRQRKRHLSTVLAQGKEKKVLAEIKLPTGMYSTPVAADGVLYVACQTHLYAVTPGRGDESTDRKVGSRAAKNANAANERHKKTRSPRLQCRRPACLEIILNCSRCSRYSRLRTRTPCAF